MSRLRTLPAFLYDFIVGDDPLIAAAVVVALGLTAGLASMGASAWWILPLAVVAVLGFSIHRATSLRGGSTSPAAAGSGNRGRKR
jgi:hypothetical protein